jgi:hypothetical protein
LLQALETELATRNFSLLRNTTPRATITYEFVAFPARHKGAGRFGSLVGVERGSQRGVDKGRVAETAAKHGLCLIRYGRRRCHGSWTSGGDLEKSDYRFPFGAGRAMKNGNLNTHALFFFSVERARELCTIFHFILIFTFQQSK